MSFTFSPVLRYSSNFPDLCNFSIISNLIGCVAAIVICNNNPRLGNRASTAAKERERGTLYAFGSRSASDEKFLRMSGPRLNGVLEGRPPSSTPRFLFLSIRRHWMAPLQPTVLINRCIMVSNTWPCKACCPPPRAVRKKAEIFSISHPNSTFVACCKHHSLAQLQWPEWYIGPGLLESAGSGIGL